MIWVFFSTLGILFALAGWVNHQRTKLKINFELRNNLLMTKHPLLFINPRRSLFYWTHPWNQIPSYLSAHGFETFEKDLPPTSSAKGRAEFLINSFHELSKNSLRFHLFFEASQADVLTEILKSEISPCICSITFVNPTEFEWPELKSPPIPVFSLTLPSEIRPPLYTLHLWLTQQLKTAPPVVGLRKDPQDYQGLLERVQTLAEKDFLESSSNV